MPDGIILHYNHHNFYYGADASQLQAVLSSASVNILDVVLLAFKCLRANKPRTLIFFDEFAKMCFTVLPTCVPTKEHYRAAAIIYFSIRKHLADAFGVSAQDKNTIAFNLVNHAFGKNKQSLIVTVKPI